LMSNINQVLSYNLLFLYSSVYHLLLSEHVENYDFSLVERFVGHGIGPILHSEPLILYHRELNALFCFHVKLPYYFR
jgi:methionine aminopeptidase